MVRYRHAHPHHRRGRVHRLAHRGRGAGRRPRRPRPGQPGPGRARRAAGLLARRCPPADRRHPGPAGRRAGGRRHGRRLPSGRAGRPGQGPVRPAGLLRRQRHRHRRAAGGHGAAAGAAPGAGLVDGGLRRGPLRLPGSRPGAPARPRRGRPGAGPVRAPLPALRLGPVHRAGHRVGPAGPAQRLRGEQGGPGATGRGVGGDDRRQRGGAALPQRVRAADAARHPVLRRGRHLPVGAGNGPGTAGDRGRRAAPGLRARGGRRGGQHGRADCGRAAGPAAGLQRGQR